jgi:bidirectional [NiFe] hydrogenase diaphorase subunit
MIPPKNAAQASESLTLQIDGKDVSCRSGQTILQVARENGIEIPTLCYLEGLSVWGGCRLCVVEVAGINKLLAACSTACAEGMVVSTNSPRLHNYRKMMIEMLFAERNHVCAVCVSNGHCELQATAQKLGVTHIHLPYRYPQMSVDSSHDRFRLDANRCILCTRCVRVCDEIEGAHTKDVKGRGIKSFIINDLDQPWDDSESCTACGKCVHVCPTGALTDKGTAVAEMDKRRQFLPYLTLMRESNP